MKILTPAVRRVLIIDDNHLIHGDFKKILAPDTPDSVMKFNATQSALFGESEDVGVTFRFELDSAYQGEEGIALVEESLRKGIPYSLAFVDVRMPPGLDGVETARRILAIDPQIQIAICTAYADYSWSELFTKIGYYDGVLVLKKPFDPVEALQMAYALTEKWCLHQVSRQKMEDLEARVEERTGELRKEKNFAENVIQTANLMFVQVDASGVTVRVNAATESITGYSSGELVGNSWLDLVPPEERSLVWDMFVHLKEGRNLVASGENGIVTKEGEPLQVIWNNTALYEDGQFAGSISFGLDVTERNRLKTLLHQTQKLETVAQLAGGVAHEFNNLLMAILGQAELLLEDLPKSSPFRDNVVAIQKGGERAAELTRQLLAYGRRQYLCFEMIDLNQVLKGMEQMIRHLIPERVEVIFNPAAQLDPVKVDGGQIEQVIVNLAMNARDAMPSGGRLVLETANVTLDGVSGLSDPEIAAGDYVTLSVADNGVGMAEDVKSRIFEPFFSTKGVGRGTGLGLSACYGSLKQNGGHLTVESEMGRGTTFTVFLPSLKRKDRTLKG